MTDSDKPLRADCTVETSGEDIRLRFRITNTSNATVHVFASSRMPYLIKQPDGSLLVLRGVNPPDPDVDYAVYEIPTTQPLEPGQSIEGQVVLNPLYLADHYEKQRTPTPLHGPVKVHFSVAWADTPIRTSDRSSMSIQQVIAWQRLIEVAELEVSFP